MNKKGLKITFTKSGVQINKNSNIYVLHIYPMSFVLQSIYVIDKPIFGWQLQNLSYLKRKYFTFFKIRFYKLVVVR